MRIKKGWKAMATLQYRQAFFRTTLALSIAGMSSFLSGCGSSDLQAQTTTPGTAAIASQIAAMDAKPHTYAAQPLPAGSTVFQYAMLDTKSVQPNIFNSKIAGINDTDTIGTAGPDSIGLVRMVVLNKAGQPTDPADPATPIGVYLDIAGLQPAMAEGGSYELFALYNTLVPPVAAARANGQAQFGTITAEDAAILAKQGTGNNVPGNIFTLGGGAPKFYSPTDVWPTSGSNVVTFPVNCGIFNALASGDAHAYFEFKPATNMVFPHHEFPFTGGVLPFYPPGGAYAAGVLGQINSQVPGSGPLGINNNDPRVYGDNPNDPRDPDRYATTDPKQREFRLRSVPSGLTEELHRDIFMRFASFHPEEGNLQRRLYLAVAKEIALVDQNNDGVLSFAELDMNGTSDGGQSNKRLYFPLSRFSRFTVQKEINDGIVAPRFANSTRGVVFSGFIQKN
jgi:hypothetical protein